MAQKALREIDAKRIVSDNLGAFLPTHVNTVQTYKAKGVQLTKDHFGEGGRQSIQALVTANPWLQDTKLVAKPDQLIKRRGKGGLLLLDATWDEVVAWVGERMGREVTVDGVTGTLATFFVEPFHPHPQSDEVYLCIQSNRGGEEILFHHEGGVEVGDVDAKALRLQVPTLEDVSADRVRDTLTVNVPEARRAVVADFTTALLRMYRALHFTYLEINPLVARDDGVLLLDMAAKLDETAEFVCGTQWGDVEFPAPFGREPAPEEAFIRDLDSKTGASLKLSILNSKGRIWTMVAGGGASVVYADTITDLGFGHELANYGEYSGAPTEGQTYEYAHTILDLMTRGEPREEGKVLIVGGGIANFTDVAQTFKGIIRALRDSKESLRRHRVSVWVRRGGPNYQEALRNIRAAGRECGLPIRVYGPEVDIVNIVPMALGKEAPAEEVAAQAKQADPTVDAFGDDPAAEEAAPAQGGAEEGGSGAGDDSPTAAEATAKAAEAAAQAAAEAGRTAPLFTPETRCIVYGMQPRAVQGMLDFDYMCNRARPSVAAMVFPFSGNHYQQFYWGKEQVLVPVLKSTAEAVAKHPEAKVLINFASFRSVLPSTMEALALDAFRVIAIIAEGVPEQYSRRIIEESSKRGVSLIGPATVGGIKPGCFRIGNTGGMLDNIVTSRLYRPGSVAYVSKSGGMSNELNNVIFKNADGVYEGVAIGGDRYPGSRFIDHILRYNDDPNVKMLVLLGEVGGADEYDVAEAIRSGRVSKPVVAWCIGTCAKIFPFEVQFGHAGALANARRETADAKNEALAAAGAIVPRSFDKFGASIGEVFKRLVAENVIVPRAEPPTPRVPMDFQWAKKLGLIRKPAAFVSTICDDRGEELLYAGMPISKVFEEDIGIGGVVSLLWLRRRLPPYACKFIEMVLMVTADHGPAVSGAHNTIVTARAGKDLISSLASGLLTIGPRFGGALDGAADMFSTALDHGMSPKEFVHEMRRQSRLIMGIGHRIKSVQNPDMRVTIIKNFAKRHFPQTEVLDFALDVEKLTTAKKANLILNVDGCIACAFVDLLRSCGAFNREEADEMIKNGLLNGLFVLGRSIGFIGHYLDQKRLKQGLYRHPWDDISYINEFATPRSE